MMGTIEPTNLSVKRLKGLHLYHSGISNCSMRVRITLEEKGLKWTSHHFDILKKEHLTPEYFGINPNGLVPTLVHDGVVVIESNDIIDYLDQTFPNPPLRPSDAQERQQMASWMQRAASIHVKAIKTHIYDKGVRDKMAQTQEEETSYHELQTNPELIEFHKKSSSDGFSEQELRAAKQTIDECFTDAEIILAKNPWLAGSMFSLADISWMPLYFTLEELAGYDFGPFPHVRDWAGRISTRDSYRLGIVDWWPAKQALAS
ncbi:MAG: glutathione S-transferase family protein [Hyphomicrobiaceae bacterium]